MKGKKTTGEPSLVENVDGYIRTKHKLSNSGQSGSPQSSARQNRGSLAALERALGTGSPEIRAAHHLSRSLIREREQFESKFGVEDSVTWHYHRSMDLFIFTIGRAGLEKAEALARSITNLALVMRRDGLSSADAIESIKEIIERETSRLNDIARNLRSKRQLQGLILPETASEADRYIPRKSGRASEFLIAHWGSYIDAGICFRPDIKRLDPKLEMALANEFRGRADQLRAILPTKSDEADARILRELGGPVRPEDRQAALTALSVAKKLKGGKPRPI